MTDEIESSLSRLERGASVIRDVVKTLTTQPGVYRMLSQSGDVLYVGKAKHLKNRVINYTNTDALPNRLQRMVSETYAMEIVTTHTETEALLLESNLIKRLQPRYNILLKDDKSFPYILITKGHPFPRIVKHRGNQVIPGDYFGPFANVAAVDEAILVIQKIFKIRNCTDAYFQARTRPCLQYHIKRCTAPCVRRIDQAAYEEAVSIAKDFLKGKTDVVQKILSEKMVGHSEALEFEKAAAIRDTIRLITDIQSRQRINISGVANADVMGLVKQGGKTCVQVFFYRYGRNFGTESFFLAHAQDEDEPTTLTAFVTQFYNDRPPAPLVLLSHSIHEEALIVEALKQKHGLTARFDVPKVGVKADLMNHALKNAADAIQRKNEHADSLQLLFEGTQKLFDLPKVPERIEVYDNSHIQGAHACGVMIVATPDGFDKKSYRKFTPKEAKSNDDFGMMREFLKRRLQHADDWKLPDLLLIDGGAGQVSSVQAILDELDLDIPMVGIAKGPDRNAGRERFFVKGRAPFSLPINDPFLHFLQRLRDEAHRFVIGMHRQKRQKAITKSQLDDVAGIGAARKKKLLLHFGSAKNVAGAAIADLERVEGISRAVAQKIYDHFHD